MKIGIHWIMITVVIIALWGREYNDSGIIIV